MRVALINSSGNVGKSTLARHLFSTRLDTEIISVETLCADRGGKRVSADDYRFIQEHLLDNDHAVIDIGSSNVEQLLRAMDSYRGSHEDIDLFVVPVIPAAKVQWDTITTIDKLHAMGIPANKIKLVFNQVDVGKKPEQLFPALYAYVDAEKKCVITNGATVYKHELYDILILLDRTVAGLAADVTDYHAALQAAESDEERQHATDMLNAKRAASTVHENLEAVYKALVG